MGYKVINGKYEMLMKSGEFWYWMEGYLLAYKELKDRDLTWDLTISTKKNPKDVRPMNLYTLFLIDKNTKQVYKQSDEFAGYNKSQWSHGEYMSFVRSLKEVKE